MGGIDDPTLEAIMRRLPTRAAVIERAFAACDSFRGLCEDYLECAAALDRWRALPSPEGSARSAEYERLMAELTRELEARLTEDGGDET